MQKGRLEGRGPPVEAKAHHGAVEDEQTKVEDEKGAPEAVQRAELERDCTSVSLEGSTRHVADARHTPWKMSWATPAVAMVKVNPALESARGLTLEFQLAVGIQVKVKCRMRSLHRRWMLLRE